MGRTPDADLLRTLANYRVDAGTYRIDSASFRIDWGRPAEPGLAQRVPGTHLPRTEPVKLHPRAPEPEPDAATPTGERQLSDDVYAFLSQFGAGGHGLDERRRADRVERPD